MHPVAKILLVGFAIPEGPEALVQPDEGLPDAKIPTFPHGVVEQDVVDRPLVRRETLAAAARRTLHGLEQPRGCSHEIVENLAGIPVLTAVAIDGPDCV